MDDPVSHAVRRAAPHPPPVDAERIVAAGRQRGRRRRVAMATGGLVLPVVAVAMAVLALPQGHDMVLDDAVDDDPAVFELPEPGVAAPEMLGDGTPVFVVHAEGGEVTVVDARVDPGTSAVSELVGWCGQSQRFEGPHLHSRFDDLGRYTGGPAMSDLNAYEATVANDRVEVGARQERDQRSDIDPDHEDARPPTGPSCLGQHPVRDDSFVSHTREQFNQADLAELPDAAEHGPVLTRGSLLITDTRARLCHDLDGPQRSDPESASSDPPRCVGPSIDAARAVRDVIDTLSDPDRTGDWYTYPGPLLVEANRDGLTAAYRPAFPASATSTSNALVGRRDTRRHPTARGRRTAPASQRSNGACPTTRPACKSHRGKQVPADDGPRDGPPPRPTRTTRSADNSPATSPTPRSSSNLSTARAGR